MFIVVVVSGAVVVIVIDIGKANELRYRRHVDQVSTGNWFVKGKRVGILEPIPKLSIHTLKQRNNGSLKGF